MKCALYVRVSTEEQVKEGFSIGGQKERLSAYALSQGWDIEGIYVDEGISAKDTNRPELNRMLRDIEEGTIDVVLVYRLDRLTRSVLDLYHLLDAFEKNNCKFKSATEVYDTTTAMGRLFITLVAALAQWERENLGERVSMGMAEKVRRGQWHGSNAPIGFDYIDGDLQINEEEASIVRRAFELYLEGNGDVGIAAILTKEGYPSPSGKHWRDTRIRYMLKNPIYKGSMQWGVRVNQDQYFTVDNAVEPIVEPEVFDRAQAIRKSRGSVHGRQGTSDYIFSGILKCPKCGRGFIGRSNTNKDNGARYKSYRCRGVNWKACDFPSISENIVIHNFIEYFKRMDLYQELNQSLDDDEEKDNRDKKAENLKKELNKIKDRRKKWQYAWANDMISDDEFTSRMNEEQKKEDSIQSQMDELNVNTEDQAVDPGIIQMLSDQIQNWEKLSDVEKKQLLQLTIDSILIERQEGKRKKDRIKIVEIIFQ